MEEDGEGLQIEEFKGRYDQELLDLIDGGIYDEMPLPPDPFSMGVGETNLEELSDEEMRGVREILFGRLGVDRHDPSHMVREYFSEAPPEATVPGQIKVQVFRTNREGLFLQEMTFADNAQRWAIGPDQNI